jgi:vesicular inhibitory amino acid transporter
MLAEMDRIPLALGLVIVMAGFAGHFGLPAIYMSMKRRDQYPEVLDTTYMVTCTVYMLMAVGGYLAYGSLTQQEVSQTIHYPSTSFTSSTSISLFFLKRF